jgi:hypothetical protein
MVDPRGAVAKEEEGMSGRSLRRAVAAGVLMTALTLLPVAAHAIPAARGSVAPDLWVRAWDWVASLWEGLAGGDPGRTSDEKQSGAWGPTGGSQPLAPNGTASTTTPGTSGTGGTGEIGPGTDPNG